MTDKRFLTRTDSYKVTHWPAYPEGTQRVYSYLESRGGAFPEVVMFGLQYYLKRYLSTRITQEMVDYAAERAAKHFSDGTVFNRQGWEYIVNQLDGRIPLEIYAAPEGMVIPNRNVLATYEGTDDNCQWITNWFETLLLKVWYPITVATLSREIKKIILANLVKTGTPELIQFKLHDFGYRGVSSEESAEIGGMAHLVNFMGTDTMIALEAASEYYNCDMAGFSIPATEHSIMCAKGEAGEESQMERFLDTFGQNPNFPAIACVSDTYNLWRAAESYWGGTLRNKVVNLNNKVLVVRPDSGDPVTVCVQLIETLDKSFGHTVNSKGYKVLNHVRIIQGDGINLNSVRAILEAFEARKWSGDNIAFGMGGALLQQVNRDTQKFAIKASSYVIKGVRYDFRKDPITDSAGKRSKAGRLKLMYDDSGVLTTVDASTPGENILKLVYRNGESIGETTFDEIRARAEIPVDNLHTVEW